MLLKTLNAGGLLKGNTVLGLFHVAFDNDIPAPMRNDA
jgi:hypothetical protein